MQRLYENLFYSKPVNELFTDVSFIAYMLRVEGALAKAQAEQGLIPSAAAKTIGVCCDIKKIDIEKLIEQVALGGNAAIPLVKQLTGVVANKDAESSKYVHFGATSQDIIDTAIALQLKDALQLISVELDRIIKQLVDIINAHRNTLMIGRTFKQHARPITFGFKVARWLEPLLRSRQSISHLTQNNLVIQLGGAVGTLSSMDGKGLKVADVMGKLLDLKVPAISHSQGDGLVEVATTLAILQGNIGKIAEDIQLLMQTEIGEVSEPALAGKGGSSSMPHKRNPVGCVAIAANAMRMPGLISTMLHSLSTDHERGTGSWHAQWETLAAIVQLSAGSVHQACIITDGLEVNVNQMLVNLELTNGLIYAENISAALSLFIGRLKADEIIEQSCKESILQKVHLRKVLESKAEIIAHLSSDRIIELFEPKNSIGLCDPFIDRVLAKQ